MTSTAPRVETDSNDTRLSGGARPSVIDPALYKRLVRRESHSSRSGTAIVLAVLLAVVVAWVGTESVIAALGRPALLASPMDVLATLRSAADGQSGLVIGAGVLAVVIGIVLVIIALAPGRRGRHEIADSRVAAIVDDVVIASSVARAARTAGRLAPSQVRAWVSRRRVGIDLTPASGVSIDDESVVSAARDELDATAYRPALQPTAKIVSKGRISA